MSKTNLFDVPNIRRSRNEIIIARLSKKQHPGHNLRSSKVTTYLPTW